MNIRTKTHQNLTPYPMSFYLMIFVYFLFLFIIDGMCIFLVISFVSEKDYGGMIFALLTMSVTSFFLIRSAVRNIKYRICIAEQRKIIRRLLSFNQWYEIQAEIDNTIKSWGTVYFLDKFIYIPKIRLMIEYENICKAAVVTRTTDGLTDGARVELTDNNELTYKVWILKWKEFLREKENFENMISKNNIVEFKYWIEKSSV